MFDNGLGLLLIDGAILVLAGLFLFIGLVLLVRGILNRNAAALYSVGRQRARNAAAKRIVQGIALLLVGAVLLTVWSLLPRPEAAAVAPPEPTATATTPQGVATVTEQPAEADPTEEPATATPTLTATTPISDDGAIGLPTPQLETQPPAEPTAEPAVPTATPEPTATPIPYDAFVNVVGGLNLRDAPNGQTVILLENGSGLFLLDGSESDGVYTWRQVRTLDGTEGWVADEFLTIVANG